MRLAEAYRSLARPSSALEPSHPLAGISSLCPTKLSERLVAKLVHGFTGPPRQERTSALPHRVYLNVCIVIGLAGIRTQGLRLAKAALYQLSYKPGFYAQLMINNSWLVLFLVSVDIFSFQLATETDSLWQQIQIFRR